MNSPSEAAACALSEERSFVVFVCFVFVVVVLGLFVNYSRGLHHLPFISVLQTICLFHFFFFNGTGIFSVDSNTYVSPQMLAQELHGEL